MQEVQKELQSFSYKMEIPVQWGDMDAAQHVNNTVYLRWFESARVGYIVQLGEKIIFNGERPGFILAKQDCKYIFPMIYPDIALVGIQVTEIGDDRFTMHCKIYSQRSQRLAAIANGVIVTFDYQKQEKAPIPQELKAAIEEMERTLLP